VKAKLKELSSTERKLGSEVEGDWNEFENY